ncbi:MAG TPA: zinc-dependent metalloprotease family protein [Thermoanaerobaculia bacterium]|nr:zinc-dependent metalloprotease family protein [Thermoanaerobaculia bacterium]
MRRLLAALSVAPALCLCAAAASATTDGRIFRDLSPAGVETLPARNAEWNPLLPRHFRVLELDVGALETQLALAPAERSALAATAPLVLALPYPDGTDRRFRVEESPILEPGLAAKFPEIRTFIAQGIDDPSATARLSITPLGFHAMVLSTSGTVLVDPYARWDDRFALAYWKRDGRAAPGASFHCEVGGADSEEPLEESTAQAPPQLAAASGTQLRTYRLALAGTVEYTTAVCAPNPAAVSCGLAAMVVSMNRVVGVYERELAIHMVLVANNDLVVYTTAPDPYTNNNCSTMLGQNVTNLNNVIGSANYDVGHVFSTNGGGVASLNVPCTANKARGCTGTSSPSGDGFDIDYVAHEMGHQFGGAHTFNGTTSNCGGGNRSASSAYEPGSGSTIMAYAGICGAEDLQPHSDDTFHVRSFDQIVAFSTGATGSSCAAITATGNTPPTVSAGANYTIPKQTPFTLTGSATDPDPDTLTYMWEEFDLPVGALGPAPPNDDVTAVRPIFRSFVPLAVPSRTFPGWSDVLANVATLGESMSTRDRTMTFRMTVRDNRAAGGGVNYASTTVTVNATAGPFVVTQPDTAVTWPGLSTQTVTWNVAGTDAAPISCANVAIDLSTDGGTNFGAALAAATPNDGSEPVAVPNTPTSQARVRVSCAGNVFFDVGNANFTIAFTPPPNLVSIEPAAGRPAGGNSVTLTGADFVDGATVLFGALPATSVTFNSPTSLTATAPAQPEGTVSVTATNPDTQSSTLVGAYTYDENAPDLPFADGFESASTAAWNGAEP